MPLTPKPISFAKVWGCLQNTMKCVITLDHVPKYVWNDRFSDVYSMCVAAPLPFCDELYTSIKLFLVNHVHELLNIVQTGGTSNMLLNYYTHWQKYSEGLKFLHSLFQHLNREYIRNRQHTDTEILFGHMTTHESALMEIEELGLDVWEHTMIVPLKNNMISLLLDEFDKLRHHQDMSPSLDFVAGVVNSFIQVQKFKKKHSLEVYKTCFEESYLKESIKYYKYEAAGSLQKCTVSKYMIKIMQILEKEELLSKQYFHISTYDKIRKLCLQNMVGDHLELFHGECGAMIKEERLEDLKNVYLLLSDFKDWMQTLIATFEEHIKQHGLRVIESLKQEKVFIHFVEELLFIHSKYKSIVVDVFYNDSNFHKALDKAFMVIINFKLVKNQLSRSPEYLSQYCDNLLNKSSKGMSEADIDYKLLQSITIFKYLDDKDVFQKFYQKHLAKRLLHQQSQSMDGEEGMINKLKQICGYEFTSKLHIMYTDIAVSEELNLKLNTEFLKPENKLDVTFSVYVLQTGAWPLATSPVSFAIPKQIIPCVQYYEEFYKTKFMGRTLTWLYHQCQGELKLNYLPKVYMIKMLTFQMAILLLFQDKDTLKLSELHVLLQLDDDQLKKHIDGLVECKLLLVVGDKVTLNMNFTNKRTKFRITAALQKSTRQEFEQTVNSVKEDRKAYLQAVIVRIMKARKVLKHTQLVNEILSQSKQFAPSISVVKKTIEILIDKEYLERTVSLPDSYSYVA